MKASSLYTKPFILYSLAGVFVIVLLFIPIRYTLSLATRYISLRDTLEQVKISGTPVREINDDFFTILNADTITHVFEVVSIAAQTHHLIIKRYEPPYIQGADDIQKQTLHIILEGEFVDILKCLQATDTRLKGIKIASIKFNREDNNKRVSLVASIVFQRIQVIPQ